MNSDLFWFSWQGLSGKLQEPKPTQVGFIATQKYWHHVRAPRNTQNTAIRHYFLGGVENRTTRDQLQASRNTGTAIGHWISTQHYCTPKTSKKRTAENLRFGCNLRFILEFNFWWWWPVIYQPIEYCFLLLAKRDGGSPDDHDQRWWVELNGCPMYLHTHWVDVRQSIRWSLGLFGYGIALGGGYPCAIPVTISEKQPVQ